MSEQGYDKVFSTMHGKAMKDQPKIDLPSYEDLAIAAVDVAHMHLRRDLLRGGFYCDVCLQRGPRESQINHLATCTAGRILAWSRGGLLAVEESAEDERLRENAKELLGAAESAAKWMEIETSNYQFEPHEVSELVSVVAKIKGG